MYVPLLSNSPPVRTGTLGSTQQQDSRQRPNASPEQSHPYESTSHQSPQQQSQPLSSQQQQQPAAPSTSRPAGRVGGPASSSGGGSTLQRRGVIAPGQPLPAGRQRDKFVPLPDEEGSGEERNQYASLPPISFGNLPTPAIFEDLPFGAPLIPSVLQQIVAADETSKRGRITLYCVSESFDRKKLDELLKLTFPPGEDVVFM